MLSVARLTSSFPKYYIEKKNNTVCRSINWPSNLVMHLCWAPETNTQFILQNLFYSDAEKSS